MRLIILSLRAGPRILLLHGSPMRQKPKMRGWIDILNGRPDHTGLSLGMRTCRRIKMRRVAAATVKSAATWPEMLMGNRPSLEHSAFEIASAQSDGCE